MTGDVLILLGCPQIPVQSAVTIYVADFVRDLGATPIVAANPSATQLIKASDPKGYYVKDYLNVDKVIENLADGVADYKLIISLIHNDAGLTYTATAAALSPSSLMVTILYGEHAYDLANEIEFQTEKVVAPVTHNTRPLLGKIDEVLEWAVLKV